MDETQKPEAEVEASEGAPGAPRVTLAVDDGAGRQLAVSLPVVRDLDLSRVAGLEVVGVYRVKIPLPSGQVMIRPQVVPLVVDRASTLADVAVEAFRIYDDHKDEARRLAMEAATEESRPKIVTAGAIPVPKILQ